MQTKQIQANIGIIKFVKNIDNVKIKVRSSDNDDSLLESIAGYLSSDCEITVESRVSKSVHKPGIMENRSLGNLPKVSTQSEFHVWKALF